MLLTINVLIVNYFRINQLIINYSLTSAALVKEGVMTGNIAFFSEKLATYCSEMKLVNIMGVPMYENEIRKIIQPECKIFVLLYNLLKFYVPR